MKYFSMFSGIGGFETGVIKKPSVYVVAKIAKALNTTLDDLIK